MAITNVSGDIKSVLERIGGMCFKAESILNLCMDGFVKHKVDLIDEAMKVSPTICNEGIELKKLLSKKSAEPDANRELIKSLMSIVSSIEMAVTGLNSTLQHIRAQISEGIPFGDKAISEIRHLLKETLDLVKTTGDTIVTRKEVNIKYVVDKYKNLNETLDAYAEEHEERLIKGLCPPQASLVYLNIVASIVKVAWHTKQAFMAITNVSGDIRSVLERIGGMCFKAESILNLCMDGFMKHKVDLIDEARNEILTIRNEGNELRKLLSDNAKEPYVNMELIKSRVSIIGSIEMAVSGLESTLQHVRTKITTEGIIFGDKGMGNIRHLFKETLDIVKTAGGTIVTRNEVLLKYVVDKYENLDKIVGGYKEEHEDRLIKGLCQPQASSVYLNIMDSLMTVVWHTKKALMRLFESG
jgi:Na+/phosphate symporter